MTGMTLHAMSDLEIKATLDILYRDYHNNTGPQRERAARLIRQVEVEHSRRLGLLLDIGQLGVPRNVTQKPAILTVEEMELMQRHPGAASR